MPDGEYETLAGFVLERLGRIPEVGERFRHEGWLVEVVEMDRRRVARLRLTAPEPERFAKPDAQSPDVVSRGSRS